MRRPESLALEAFNLLGAGGVLRRELDLGVGRAASETLTPRTWRLGGPPGLEVTETLEQALVAFRSESAGTTAG